MSAPAVLISAGEPLPDAAARHLRASFAERHVPLPAALARDLARLLAAPQPLSDPGWGRAFARMAQGLGVSGSVASQQLLKTGLDRFALIVAEPVLLWAAARAGALPLTARGAVSSGIPVLATAQAGIEAGVALALSQTEAMGAAFWAHAALDLICYARQRAAEKARISTAGAAAEEIDPALAALVFVHQPVFSDTALLEKLRRRARKVSARRRSGLRPKEGGVTGILQSRNIDDLPDALMSEMILPRALFANKLLHEGLLTRHRPPRRDPKRDLLAVMLHQADRTDPMGLLVEAAWADATIRLRLALAQMDLSNSDLAWSGPAAALSVSCQMDLKAASKLPPTQLAGKARADMLLRSGLYPAHAICPRPEGQTGADSLTALRLRAALAAVSRSTGAETGRFAQEYGHRFVLTSVPVAGRLPDWAELRATQLVAAERDMGQSHHAALVWDQGSRGQPPRLTGYADGRSPVEFAPPGTGNTPEEPGLEDFLGSVVLWIMDVTLEALDVA